MALYWPEQRVALDIIDDPLAKHVDERELVGWNVIKTTLEEVGSLEGSCRVGDALCIAMGQEPPEKTPEWLAANERLHYKLKEKIPGLKENPYCVGE